MKNKKVLGSLTGAVLLGIVIIILTLTYSSAPVSPVLTEGAQEQAEFEEGRELFFLQDSGVPVEGMRLVARQGEYSLYYNPETAEVAVKDAGSGDIWHSNPVDASEDTLATPYEKESLASQFSLEFRDEKTNLLKFRSYPDSVQRGQFTAEGIEDGLRVIYTLGDNSKGIDLLPKYISADRLEEAVLSKLDEATAKYVALRYYKVKDRPGLLERLDDQVGKELVLKKMLTAFEQAGYDESQLAIDNEENGVTGSSVAEKPQFVVPLEYRLTSEGLKVNIPMSQVEENPKYPLHKIEFMEYFGAAGAQAEGYMFVPDGSGALIHLNNGKINDDRYSQELYGGDKNQSSRNRLQVTQNARLPVFGLKEGTRAWYATIMEGDGIASVNADVGGKLNNYNHVYASFQIRSEDELFMMSGNKLSEVRLTTKLGYRGAIGVKYSFLQGESANYAGMARNYQQQLVKDGRLGVASRDSSSAGSDHANTNLPFHVDVYGAITKQTAFLGVPYNAITALTTLDEAGQMGQDMQEAGISNIQMRLVGWSKGGVNHKLASATTQGKVGSNKQLAGLSAWLKEQGGALYPDVAFQQVHHDTLNFSPSQDAARFITREVASQSPYRSDLNRMSHSLYGSYYLLSPAKLSYYVDDFIKGYQKLGVPDVSLRDLGDVLYGDYRASRIVDRQQAKEVVEAELAKLDEKQGQMLIVGGNEYALAYADYVIDAPNSSSGFNIVDEEVPFYQLVLHGYVGYAGEAVNLSPDQDLERALLKMIEYGAAPHFAFTKSPSSEVKFTSFDAMYSTYYMDWLREAADLYAEANAALGPLQKVRMTDHRLVQEGVYETVYENGVRIWVNYTDQAVLVEGQKVKPMGYEIGGGAR
ncbi:DUF5696 domain-containing protein [Paenibacillus fonticola]|uniref:DUF5696 domain-containing protein n=1 Tax=Paenibacillus fonticola TaxID=379896 RepID=UPI000372244B|nr:DUF5696 domain-containing protein [Paenibacillus fonticola]